MSLLLAFHSLNLALDLLHVLEPFDRESYFFDSASLEIADPIHDSRNKLTFPFFFRSFIDREWLLHRTHPGFLDDFDFRFCSTDLVAFRVNHKSLINLPMILARMSIIVRR